MHDIKWIRENPQPSIADWSGAALRAEASRLIAIDERRRTGIPS